MTARRRIAIGILLLVVAVRYIPIGLSILRATRTLLAVDIGSPFQTTKGPPS